MTRPVGYLLDFHLQTSQTFVSNEIDELRRQGRALKVVALRHGDRDVADPDVLHLSDHPVRRRRALLLHAGLLVRHPVGFVRYLWRLRQVRSEIGLHGSQVDWRRLPVAAHHLRDVEWLHAHFAWGAAAAAYVLAGLLGVPWSFTAHANDVFSRRRNLEVKLRAADRVVTVCDYNVAWLREHLGVTRPLDLVVCGVEVPELDDPPRTPEVDVVAVGRLVEKKGFDVLVEATALLAAARPGVRVEILGDGPWRARLEERAAELGLGDALRLPGSRPHEDVLARVAVSRVLTLPARVAADGDRDSMPVVVKEAMARAVPVVATDVVAIPEMVDETVGRLVPVEDPAALAAALQELLDDDALRARLGAAARARVLQRFTLSGEVAKLSALLRPGRPAGR